MFKEWSKSGQRLNKEGPKIGQKVVKDWSKSGQKIVKEWPKSGQNILCQESNMTPVAVPARSKCVGLRPLACWGYGFESLRLHGHLSHVNFVCYTASDLGQWPIPR